MRELQGPHSPSLVLLEEGQLDDRERPPRPTGLLVRLTTRFPFGITAVRISVGAAGRSGFREWVRKDYGREGADGGPDASRRPRGRRGRTHRRSRAPGGTPRGRPCRP